MVTPTKVGRDIAGSKGHLVLNFTSNDLDPGKWQPFLGSEIRFFALFSNLFWLFQRNLVGTLPGVRGTLSVNLTSNNLDLGKWPPF